MEEAIQCDQKAIDAAEAELLREFRKDVPQGWYTTFVTKWNDGTFQIEVRHGEPVPEGAETCAVWHWLWYNGEITKERTEHPAQPCCTS